MRELMRLCRLRITPVLMAASLLAPASLHAAERLEYLVQYKGVLSGFAWTDVSRAAIHSSTLADCSGRGPCMTSTATMSSRGYAVLEAIFKVRFHTRSFYQPRQWRTLAFEMRERKYSKQYLPYGYKHSLSVFPPGEDGIDYFELGAEGEPLPAALQPFVATDHLPAAGIRVAKVRRKPIAYDSIDRLTLLQRVRAAPLKKGYSAAYNGTNGRKQLQFRVTVLSAEDFTIADKQWQTWKIRVDELEKGDRPVSLFAWVSRDSRKIPVKIEFDSTFGSARFVLQSW